MAEVVAPATRLLTTAVHDIKDNDGYNLVNTVSTTHPLNKRLANISLVINGGSIIDGGKQNTYDGYGFLMRVSDEGIENKDAVEVRLQYNYDQTGSLAGRTGKTGLLRMTVGKRA
jgi:hypothetical protein